STVFATNWQLDFLQSVCNRFSDPSKSGRVQIRSDVEFHYPFPRVNDQWSSVLTPELAQSAVIPLKDSERYYVLFRADELAVSSVWVVGQFLLASGFYAHSHQI